MRIFRLFVFMLSIVVGLTAYQPKVRAAEYYDNAQLKYLFNGSKFKIDGLYCSPAGSSNKNSSVELDIVRRHINWNNQRPDLKEDLAHLVQYIKRRVCGIASAGLRLFSVLSFPVVLK